MPADIAFYVHHHGSGHLMRSIAISKHLPTDCQISFLGSNLEPYQNIIPNQISCIHLPMDIAVKTDANYHPDRELAGLHYAPLNVQGQANRVSQMVAFFTGKKSLLLVVDVSVEVAMLARLCGIPTIIIRQHGFRTDLPHQIAYQNAALLIAPYPALLKQDDPEWLDQKTFYTGGYSRFNAAELSSGKTKVYPNQAAVLIGSGGTSIDVPFISYLATTCPDWHFNVIGKTDHASKIQSPNVTFYGHLTEPFPVLMQSSVLIGNTGHNTVMEAASLNKTFITIPESRPFDEQLVKADLLKKLSLATIIYPENLYYTDWQNVLKTASQNKPNWQNIIDENALSNAANKILDTYNLYFKSPEITA